MAQVIWTEPALQELDQIADFISLYNEGAASELVKNVLQKIDLLYLHPEIGKPVDEIKPSVYKEIFVNPCRVFYRLEKDRVYILHVMRFEQNLKKELIKGR